MNWIRTHRWFTAGLGAAVVGLALVITAAATQPSREFGWFAYAPLADAVFLPGPTAREMFGIGLASLGLIVITGSLGYLRGRRTQ
ncbi:MULTISPECIES: hypothetical protein [unclassified Arthrobacter]|uniref:hypothetical protein n=1 Tax=unclassified Arthrobacter TaxID=235627 RepID=UPI00149216FC|nr:MULTISPECIES: hypothetical protein [unclassified Arthrobacter]MBE0010405.1 hypothetical protein [Arthrobacter sp. AET 35A]NOJ59141.1 hypothetical protein [Arthrobacter sp. 260]NOJ64272.1 hypothetical protein [Arthrobacter sp. 147(2020)]